MRRPCRGDPRVKTAIERRVLAGALLVALCAVPSMAAPQGARVFQIGILLEGGPYARAIDGLRDGLKELGFEDGKQYVVHVRDAKGDPKAAEAAARDLEREKVDLIYTLSSSVTVAAKRATKSVPIVFYAGSDPVSVGLVESYRRPGGRLTGIHGQSTDLTGKRLELLKELLPDLHRIVTFHRPDNPASQEAMKAARYAARQLGVQLVERPVQSVEALRSGMQALRPGEVDAFLYVADATVKSQSGWIIDNAKAKQLPTMFSDTEAVTRGALASYGFSYYAIGRLSAKPVHRVLLGANPAELPVEQLDTQQLAINLRTAKALGLAVPPLVLNRADELIR